MAKASGWQQYPQRSCAARATRAKPKRHANPVGESKKDRLAALPARLQGAAGMGPRVRLDHTAFLALAWRFSNFSQVLSE